MKRQEFSIIGSILGAAAALFLCLTWGASPRVSGTVVAAPLGVASAASSPLKDASGPSVGAGSVDLSLDAGEAPAGWVIECADCPAPAHLFTDMTDRSLKLDASGHPHIAYGENYLYYAWYDGANWHHETVDDDSPDVGGVASLVLDSDGYPHISYYADTDDDLKYAYQDVSGWHVEIVDTDVQDNVGVMDISLALGEDGYPHISYCNSFGYFTSDLKYAYRDGSGWHTETVDSGNVGKSNSLALDGDGHVHIVYEDDIDGYSDTDTSLRYAYLDGSGWHSQTVDSRGGWSSIGRYNSMALEPTAPYTPHLTYKGYSDDFKYAYLDGSTWHTQTLDFKGAYPSLTLLQDVNPHFSYTDGGLMIAYLDGSGWQSQTLVSGNGLMFTSLDFDGEGYAHISYYDSTTRDLKHTYRDATGWHSRVVDTESDGGSWVGEYTSLALDDAGYAHVSYYDETGEDLKYAYQDGSGWISQTVDSPGDVGEYASLVLDGDGYPHISYYDDTHNDLKYAYQDASGWHSQTVDSHGTVGQYTSLALEPTAPYTPHISYYDATNEHPKYAYLGATGWHSRTVGTGYPAGTYTSLVLGSDGYPHISYYCHYFGDLRHTHQISPAGWTESVVAYYSESWNKVGRFNSLSLDSLGNPYISYYDEFLGALRVATGWAPVGWSTAWTVDSVPAWDTALVMSGTYPHVGYYDALNGNLKYAYQDGLGWHVQTVDSDGDVGRYTALALDGARRPHISYHDADRHTLKHAYFSTQPLAAFAAHPATGVRPLTVVFTDTSTGGEVDTWQWSFGDGVTSALQNPTHIYTAAGTYTVTLAVSGPGGSDVISQANAVIVYTPVQAGFTAAPTSGTVPLEVAFTNTSSGDYATCLWEFGDGLASESDSPTHTYTAAGTYTVTLTVDGPGGNDAIRRTNYITAAEPPPQVDFVGDPRSGEKPLTVQFTSTVTGTVMAYHWSFGDDGTADTPNPAHTYRRAGSFGVTLVATGPGGIADVSKPDYVTVSAPPEAPTASFSADVVSGTAPLTVTFTAVTSGTVEHWLWSFGDGGTASTGPVVSHTYVTTGTFDVGLTVSNTHGSFVVSKPDYIALTTEEGTSWFVYLPVVLRRNR